MGPGRAVAEESLKNEGDREDVQYGSAVALSEDGSWPVRGSVVQRVVPCSISRAIDSGLDVLNIERREP